MRTFPEWTLWFLPLPLAGEGWGEGSRSDALRFPSPAPSARPLAQAEEVIEQWDARHFSDAATASQAASNCAFHVAGVFSSSGR